MIKEITCCSEKESERPLLIFMTYSGLGDLIMALPLLVNLKSRYRVFPVIQERHEGLARLLCDDGILEAYLLINASLRFRRNPLEHLKICHAVSRLRPEVVLIYGKHLLALAARLGLFRTKMNLFCFPERKYSLTNRIFKALDTTGNQMRDYLSFAETLGVHCAKVLHGLSEPQKKMLVQNAKPSIGFSEYVVVAPRTSDYRREATLHFFRECIKIIAQEERLPVVVTGTSENCSAAVDLVEGFSNQTVLNLVGKTNIQDLLGLLAGARFLLSNDSGNLHLAVLVNTPSVVVTGPTVPKQRLFEDSIGKVRPIQLGLSCSPCKGFSHQYRCPGPFLHCLTGLTPSHAREVLIAACQSSMRSDI